MMMNNTALNNFTRSDRMLRREPETSVKTRDALVELQAHLGQKRQAHMRATDAWLNDPVNNPNCQTSRAVRELAKDIKRIEATILALGGQVPRRQPWSNQ